MEARVDATASHKKWAREWTAWAAETWAEGQKFLFFLPHGSENQASLTLRWKCGNEGPMMWAHTGLHGSTGSCRLDAPESPGLSSTGSAPWDKWSYAGPSVTCSTSHGAVLTFRKMTWGPSGDSFSSRERRGSGSLGSEVSSNTVDIGSRTRVRS